MLFLESFPQKNMAFRTVFNVDQDWPKRIMCLRTETRNQALSSSPRTPRGNYICCYIVARCLKKTTLSKISAERSENAELASASPQPSCSSLHHLGKILVIFCSFAAKASLSLSVGKLLFFVLSSLKHQKITPAARISQEFSSPTVRRRFLRGRPLVTL